MVDPSTAIHSYAENAKAHGEASGSGDYQRANEAHDRVIAAYRELRECGDAGIDGLQALMRHDDPGVRCFAATHMLPFSEKEAVSVLRKLSEGPGVISFSATMVLKEWQKGTLVPPT